MTKTNQQMLDEYGQVKYSIKELQWDKNYFNIPCFKLDIEKELDFDDWENLKPFINQSGFITITSKSGFPLNRVWIAKNTKAFLADTNVLLSIKHLAKLDSNIVKSSKITILSSDNFIKYNEQIDDIINGSFIHSRFLNDNHISKAKALGVYSSFYKNSANTPNKYCSFYIEDNQVLGFILFSIHKNSATLELVATKKDLQGKGIGKKLINSVLLFISKKEITSVYVGTQQENLSAIRFYCNNNFKLTSIRYIYHLWNEA